MTTCASASLVHLAALKELEKGLKQGREEGAAEMLVTVITAKFGPLPGWAGARIEQASSADLKRWAPRVLTAQRIEEVFA